MRNFGLFLVIMLAVAVVGCKSAEEREDQAYLGNMAICGKLEQTYPAFKEFLQAGREKATKAYEDANGSEGDERAAKLSIANSAFGPAFTALKRYVGVEHRIRDGMKRLDQKRARTYETGADKRTLWEETDRILEEAHKTITELKPENEGQGAAEVMRQVERLQTLDNRIQELLRKAEAEESRDRERKQRKKSKNQ